MNVEWLKEHVRRWGWTRSIFQRAMKRLQMYFGVDIYRIFRRPLGIGAPITRLLPRVSVRFLDRETLLAASEDPELHMSRAFVESALTGGDIAVGAFDEVFPNRGRAQSMREWISSDFREISNENANPSTG